MAPVRDFDQPRSPEPVADPARPPPGSPAAAGLRSAGAAGPARALAGQGVPAAEAAPGALGVAAARASPGALPSRKAPESPSVQESLSAPAVQEALRAYVKLFRAHRAVLARVAPRLGRRGLTATQLGVLEALLHKGALTQRELGRKVLTSAGNMTDVLDKLTARGLVRRVRGTADRRMVQVELSQQGRAMIGELFPRHAADIAWAMSALAPEELATLGKLLRRLGREPAEEPALE